MRATLYLSAKPQYCLEVASTAAILDTVITKTFFKKKIWPDRFCECGWQDWRWLKTATLEKQRRLSQFVWWWGKYLYLLRDDERTVIESLENQLCSKQVNLEELSTCMILSYFTVPSVIFLFIFPALSYLQVLVGESAVPAIHRLEQVSTEEKVGSLAENLLEALRDHPDVEKKVSWSIQLLKQMCIICACAWAFPVCLISFSSLLPRISVLSRSNRVDELPDIWRELKFLNV